MMRRTAVDMENSESVSKWRRCLCTGSIKHGEEISLGCCLVLLMDFFMSWFLCWIYGRG